MLVKWVNESKNDIVSFVKLVSFAYLRADQQSYWETREEPIQALAFLRLPCGRASLVVIEIRYCALSRTSRQLVEAVVRFWLPEEEARMDLTIDWAVRRLSEETEIDE